MTEQFTSRRMKRKFIYN